MAQRSFADLVPCDVFTPREYQVELLEEASKRSIIICLNTGSGKTFIAVMLIKEMAPAIRRPWSEGGQRTFFLATTVPLVAQQAAVLEQHTDFVVGQFVGSAALDAWNKRDWETHLERYQVLVMSTQIFTDMLQHGFIEPARVNLLVLDECHHTIKASPMRQIMKLLKDCPPHQRPRVLGLSASIITSKMSPAKLETAIGALQDSTGCVVRTSSNILSVIKYSTQPKEMVVECRDYRGYTELHQQLQEVAQRCLSFLAVHRYAPREVYGEAYREFLSGVPDPIKDPKSIMRDFIYILNTLGPWCADRAAFYLMVEVEKMKRKTAYDRHFLLLGMVLSDLVRIRTLCEQAFDGLDLREQVCRYSSPKVVRLIDILRSFAPPTQRGATDAGQPSAGTADLATHQASVSLERAGGCGESCETRLETPTASGERPSEPAARERRGRGVDPRRPAGRFACNADDPMAVCGIVFVKQRITAKVLYRLMKELGEELSFLYPQYIMGGNRDSFMASPEVGEAERKKQEDVLRRFRSNECNLVVSTSVLEEGVDVPRCNLVVRFDEPAEYRSYVQSKGRARAAGSYYLLMTTSDELNRMTADLANYHVIEKRLMAHCQEDSAEPTETEQTRELAERLLLPYRPAGPHSAQVTRHSAISLVNRYCQRLPSDTFTRLAPQWSIEERPAKPGESEQATRMFRCMLRLPINSPVKECVLSDWMESKCLARQSAALKMCRIVHEMGELDDYLLPIGKEALLDDNAEEQREWVPDGAPRPGTTKRRQYYKKQTAPCLSEVPQPGQRCFLYQLEMRLSCPVPEDQNTRGRRLFRPEQHPRRLGLLTAAELPQVGAFPIFTRSGEVMVSVLRVAELQPDADQLQQLARFHRFVFSSVLRLETFPMRFMPAGSSAGYFVVPVNLGEAGSLTLDWPFLRQLAPRYDGRLRPLSDDERAGFTFDRQSFLDAVIMPWYRNQDQPRFFYVAEICHHLNPGAAFPEDQFGTFTDYYHSKYGIRIQNQQQPLLDVDHTPARLNLLTPRFVNRKGVALPATRSETKRAKRESLQQKQILVPELCAVHPFPASLWRKVVTLPSVLYRLNGLLVADSLRRRVALEVHLGTPELQSGRHWPQLTFGWNLAEVLSRRDQKPAGADGSEPEPTGEATPTGRPSRQAAPAHQQQFDIGTWSNEQSDLLADADDAELAALGPDLTLPDFVTLLDGPVADAPLDWGAAGSAPIRYGSPTYLSGGGGGGGPVGWEWPDGAGSAGSDQSELSDTDEEEDEDDGAARPSALPPTAPAPPEQEEEDLFDFFEDVLTLEDVRERMEQRAAKAHARIRSKYLLPASAAFEVAGRPKRASIFAAARAVSPRDVSPHAGNSPSAVSPTALSPTAASPTASSHSSPTIASPTAASHTAYSPVSASPMHENIPTAAFPTTTAAVGPEVQPAGTRPLSSGTTKRPHAEASSSVPAPEGTPGRVIVATPAGGGATCFDEQPDLESHAGPSPAMVLQALTMSNANDGINLERLETVGDSFLKFAITVQLYLTYPSIHEGKLSYLRSKRVSNLNLYRLGQRRGLGQLMVVAKFEPHDNWLPPGYTVPDGLEEEIVVSGVPAGHLNLADMTDLTEVSEEAAVRALVRDRCRRMKQLTEEAAVDACALPSFLPYNLLTQHSIPDKSVADCVESLIGAYLVSCGPKGALVFLNWLGIPVLPRLDGVLEEEPRNRVLERERRPPPSPLRPISSRIEYGDLPSPPSPVNCTLPRLEQLAAPLLSGLDRFERSIEYHFVDKFYLLQAFTHASYHRNTLTDCYQRLEFLGDAVLDYLITRHLYEDPRNHSPGALTDLRSALVNNAIFATLAVRYDFHKYFMHYSPGLHQVITTFLSSCGDSGRTAEEYLYMQEDECEAAEDIEVPKALGDVFESVAGAVYMDSGMSLDTVWRVYFRMMRSEIEAFSEHVPKSPVRELLELEPDTAKFRKPERCMNGKTRVTVDVFGKGSYKGIGRNYRIAKCTAAKRALRALKRMKSSRAARDQPLMYGSDEP